MFGVANQLLAAIALSIGTTVIIKAGKTKYAWTTFIPMVFMFTTTLTASWQLIWIYLEKASKALSHQETLSLRIDAGLVTVMAVLALVVLGDIVYKWRIFFSSKSIDESRDMSVPQK
jgi:carbon starvation protein